MKARIATLFRWFPWVALVAQAGVIYAAYLEMQEHERIITALWRMLLKCQLGR